MSFFSFQCGSKNSVFSVCCNHCQSQLKQTCAICHCRGHNQTNCPDKWRRYHSTTKDNTNLTTTVVPNKVKYCCICTGHGHTADNCRSALSILDYPVCKTQIHNYSQIYPKQLTMDDDDDMVENPANGLQKSDVEFKIETKLEKYGFYNRFLKSVGLNEYDGRQKSNKRKSKESESKTTSTTTTSTSTAKKFKKNDVIVVDETTTMETINTNTTTNNDGLLMNFSFSNEIKKLTPIDTPSGKFDLNFIGTTTGVGTSTPVSSSTPMKRVECKTLFMEEMNTSGGGSSNQKKSITSTDQTIKIVLNAKTDQRNVKYDEIGLNCADSDSNYSFSELYTKTDDELPKFVVDLNADRIEEVDDTIMRRPNDIDQNHGVEDEVECQAKIYLSKCDTQTILSKCGNDMLKDMIPKYKLTVQMEWHNIGNVLVITGLPSEQNKFQVDLLKSITDIGRKDLSKIDCQLPKRRSVLINFLKSELLLLNENLGNANVLYKQMMTLQDLRTKTSQKSADRTRKLLNVILFGQYGLGNGKIHLDGLRSNLQKLVENKRDLTVPIEFRDKIYNDLKYIFTPFEHKNYDTILNEYNRIKNNNTTSSPSSSTVVSPLPITKTIKNDLITSTTATVVATSTTTTTATPSNSNSIPLTPLPPIISEEDKTTPSTFWSNKCELLIDKCKNLLKDSPNYSTNDKLERVFLKAKENRLCFVDYEALTRIIGIIENKNKN